MNYIGSKLSLIDFLEESINKVVDQECKVFCDLFAGTGIVGRHFKQKGYSIIANDLQHYSYVLNKQYIENHKNLEFKKLLGDFPFLENIDIPLRKGFVCKYLAQLPALEGFIYQNYCAGGTKDKDFERLYFTDENAGKCDAIRVKIENWKKEDKINSQEYYFLVTTLLENIDKLANTASVYGAFLKKIKKVGTKTTKYGAR